MFVSWKNSTATRTFSLFRDECNKIKKVLSYDHSAVCRVGTRLWSQLKVNDNALCLILQVTVDFFVIN